MRITNRHLVVALVLATAFVQPRPMAQETESSEEKPVEVGLVEAARRDLVQIDLTIRGPAETIGELTADDLNLFIAGEPITDFLIDKSCQSADETLVAQRQTADSSSARPALSPPSTNGHYLFYFDQHHLTPEGRQRSLDLARSLIPELVDGGDRGMVVSSGKKTEIFVNWTSDPQALLEGLDRLEQDRSQWDSFPGLEEMRVAQLFGDARAQSETAMGLDNTLARQQAAASAGAQRMGELLEGMPVGGGVADFGGLNAERRRSALQQGVGQRGGQQAGEIAGLRGINADSARVAIKNNALRYQKEERFHAQKALTRFSMVLSWLADVGAPKSVLYFADTMRANPGQHYVAAFSDGECQGPGDTLCQVDAGSIPAYQAAIDEAAKYGIRLYTVQARGLVLEAGGSVANRFLTSSFGNKSPSVNTRRFSDAKNALAGWAAETGGEAFLNGVGPKKIIQRIRDDLDCIFLISFDAGDLPRDEALPVLVQPKRVGIEIRARPRLIIQSDTARRQARLTAAYLRPHEAADDTPLRAGVIPLGFDRGRFAGLVQVTLPQFTGGEHDWDVGLVVVARDEIKSRVSQRVRSRQSRLPVVFELEVEFPPGPYELIVVAHDRSRDSIYSARGEGEWPSPKSGAAEIGPVAIVQLAEAAFVRGATTRNRGTRVVAPGDWVRPELPAALVGIVCAPAEGSPRGMTIARRVVGESTAEFDLLEPDPEDRCYLIRDLVPPSMLTSGRFTYEIELRDRHTEVIASSARSFTAVGGDFELVWGAEPE